MFRSAGWWQVSPTNFCPSNIKGHVFKGRARDQKRHIVLNHLLTAMALDVLGS